MNVSIRCNPLIQNIEPNYSVTNMMVRPQLSDKKIDHLPSCNQTRLPPPRIPAFRQLIGHVAAELFRMNTCLIHYIVNILYYSLPGKIGRGQVGAPHERKTEGVICGFSIKSPAARLTVSKATDNVLSTGFINFFH